MNRLITLVYSIITFTTCFGQTKLDDFLKIQEYDFYYKDSIDNVVSFGDYEPTGLVSFDDGSLIISTQFSIDFPGQYQTPDSFTVKNPKLYSDQQKKFNAKSHISSGSVFKLDLNFEKKWEIFFKDKPVVKIVKLNDQSVIVTGNRVDQKKFWMAQIDTAGNIIWQKEYRLNCDPGIENMVIDSLGNSFLLVRSERVAPISITKYYGKRRIRFFNKVDLEGNIYLLKVSGKGNVLWTRCLDKTKKIEKFGNQLFIDLNIYASTYYEGFIKQKSDWLKKEGETLFEIKPNGKIIKTSKITNRFQYHYNNNHYEVTVNRDTLNFYTITSTGTNSTDTITIADSLTPAWIDDFLTMNNSIYLLGNSCFVVQLDKDNHYIGYWYDNVRKGLIDAIVKPDGTIIVISRCSKETEETNNGYTLYINVAVVKKNGT